MTVWEKSLVNMERGYARLNSFAKNVSERVKSDINIVRVRMQMDELRKKLEKQHAVIGNRLLEQSESGSLPSTFELFFKQDDIAASLERIIKIEKDLDGLEEELNREAAAVASPSKKDEGKAA